jgi:hypothetical protein
LFNVQSPLVGFSCVFKAVPRLVFVVVLVHDVAELACLMLQQADASGDGFVDYDEFVQLYTKYPVYHHSAEELEAIEQKWELSEQIVSDSRPDRWAINNKQPPRWEIDPRCQPGVMVIHVRHNLQHACVNYCVNHICTPHNRYSRLNRGMVFV